jgi:succinate dehydrogenase membrane anchor subunit
MSDRRPPETTTLVADPHARRHWLGQRASAIAMLPLGLWFMYMLLHLPALDHATVTAWIAEPLQALLLSLFALCALWHSALGVQVVVEDYVGGRLFAPTARILNLAHWAAAFAIVWSILAIALGSA